MTITEFLLACIDADEAVARAVGPTRYWLTEAPRRWEVTGADGARLAGGESSLDGRADALVDHNARHQPGRVLAECKAKRAIVEMFNPDMPEYGSIRQMGDRAQGFADGWTGALDDTLRALAAIYADREGYRAEWAL